LTACVLDSSVAAKWFFSPEGETLVVEARRLLADYVGGKLQLLVPDLFWVEIGNIVWKSARRGRISPQSAGEAIDTLLETNIPTIRSQPLLKDAFRIATRYDRTVCDALYVALAFAHEAPLVTADERLANALAARAPVRWLGAL
jgi:predicted nucleic acid-binding protein